MKVNFFIGFDTEDAPLTTARLASPFCATDRMFDQVSIEAFPLLLFRYVHFCAFARGRLARTVVAGLGDRLGRIRCRRNRVGFSTVFVDFSSAASLAARTGIPSMRIIVHAPCDKFEGHRAFEDHGWPLATPRLSWEMVLRIL